MVRWEDPPKGPQPGKHHGKWKGDGVRPQPAGRSCLILLAAALVGLLLLPVKCNDPVIPAAYKITSPAVNLATGRSAKAPNCDVQYSPIHSYTSNKAPLKISQLQVYNVCKSEDLSTFWSRMLYTYAVWETTNDKTADCTDWHEIRFHVLFEETTKKFDYFFQDFEMGCDTDRHSKYKQVDIPDSKNKNLYWGPNKDNLPIWHSWNTLAIPNLVADEHWEEGGKLAQFP